MPDDAARYCKREIYIMSHKVESMAYVGETPWHGLGYAAKQGATPKQMAVHAKVNWGVEKRPLMFLGNDGQPTPAANRFALVRDSDGSMLDVCSAKYKPVQNAQVIEFFQKFCDAGHMTMETVGSLWDGRYIWALARLGKDFAIGGKANDEVRPYLLIMSPHITGKALVMQYTPIRVVCWNTLNFALGGGLRGDGSGFRMPHTQTFESQVPLAEQALGLALQQTDEFKQASQTLAKAKITAEQREQFFLDVLQIDPADIKPKKAKGKSGKAEDAEKVARIAPMLVKFRAAVEHAPGADMITAKGTWWGALNAVTYVVDHANGKSRETALKNAWLGNHANTKRRAMALALDYGSR